MSVYSMASYLAGLAVLAGVANAATPPIGLVPQSEWAALNQSVGGRLAGGRPVALPCYANYNGVFNKPDLGQCLDVQKNKANGFYIAERFGGYQYSNWADCSTTGDSCSTAFLLPDLITPLLKPCKQGSIPDFYIEVQKVSDVQAGLAFAKKHKIPLVIKNTGHDYKGRSSAPKSLALWTHKVQPPITLTRDFVPDGCSSSDGDAITFGAGQGFAGIYQFAHDNGLHVVGGTSSTVGAAGGWITGGGHSALSNTLGLGVDNVQQLKAVLPNGTYVTANRCQNQDIFFALRGGGGGTFGVIMEMTTKAHPAQELQTATFVFGTLSLDNARRFIKILVENANKWASEGWGGYAIPALATNLVTAMTFATPKLTLDEARASMKPITDFLGSLDSLSIPFSNDIRTAEDFYDFFQTDGSGILDNLNGGGNAISSRLVPSPLFDGAANQSALVDALYSLVTAGQTDSTLPILPLFICITAPSLYQLPPSDQPGGPGASAVTSAWRSATWHVLHYRQFDSANPLVGSLGGAAGAFAAANKAMNPLRQLSPGSGAYQNEADVWEPDHEKSFWGANYERLLRIKKEVDPDNVLTCHQCVGWDESDPRYGCYPKASN